ncbi:MAG: glycosyltransferase, partial [Phycisphaeraceae bacterium]
MSSAARTPSNVSVIVPTLNEAAYLPRTVRSLALRGGDELIVVDGGSVDETPAVAARCGAHRVISAPPGRARQLNAGAALAHGAVLLFLHADTTLSDGALEAVRRAMRDR